MAKNEGPVIVRIADNQAGNKTNDLFVYVVDKNGNVVETTPFNDNAASLRASRSTVAGGRLFIAAAFPKDFPAAKITPLAPC